VDITLEAFLTPFAEYFRAQGWRVDALANGATGNEHIAEAFDNRLDVAWSRNPLAPSNLLGTATRVREIVSEGRYDLVHVHTPIAAFVTRYALRSLPAATRPVVVYTAHGFHFYEGGSALRNRLYRTMERIAAPWTDYLVTINDEDYRAARALGGIAPERVRFIPGIGVDLARFEAGSDPAEKVEAVRRELDLAHSAFAVTMVAEFAPVKRHAHVLQALARVTDPRVVLVLVGEGPLEPRLREQVAALRLSERVRFAGYRRDIPAVLAASDALLLASEREGLPRSVLEGMAAGLPVIGTATRGITDAVGSPDAGWIAPKHDVAALAAAIDAAASDPAEAARRGTMARARASAEFALPRIIQAYEELYREALASRL
jgi:glycosyltransferase involved in cell wall biosynthesis